MTKQEFKHIYNQYFNVIRNYIYYRSGSTELATDIAQEVFIKVWEKQFVNEQGQIKSLLYKVASDILINHIRHKKIVEENIPEIRFRLLESEDNNDQNQELKAKYERALAKIPDKQRTVFLMNKLDGLTYKEIAEDLNISVKAIEKRMGQALKILRNEIQR